MRLTVSVSLKKKRQQSVPSVSCRLCSLIICHKSICKEIVLFSGKSNAVLGHVYISLVGFLSR